MVEGYREPSIEYENGICFIQNGTYDNVSNKDMWDIIEPILNMFNANSEFFQLIKLGCDQADRDRLILELKTIVIQISKMVTKIKRAGGKIAIPDAKYFTLKFEEISKKDNVNENIAFPLTNELRICLRNCVTFNFETAIKLNEQGHEIEIPNKEDMELIRLKVTADQEKNQKKNKSILNRIFNRKE